MPSSASGVSENAAPEEAKLKATMATEEYPSNKKRAVIMGALYLALFLVTLDQNIISTAIPRITDEFDSIQDVGWYGTGYLLTMCSFQLFMGKVYKFYPAKLIFLAGCLLFEVGSAVCGAAPSSNAFIVGRAIAGLGSSAIFPGIMVILFHTVPLRQRPIYQGFFGAIFAVASVIGPLVGGSFTDKVTWRWCFYINLPIGAVSMVVTFFFLNLQNQKTEARPAGWVGKFKQLDPIGNLVFFPGIISLVLALQWGGTKYAWSDARIIVLLVLCGVLCLAFIGVQAWKGEEATVPPRIALQRSVAASVWFGFFNGAAMMVIMYYLPLWFQAVKGSSAIESGIMLLPMVLATVVGVIGSGIIISRLGHYAPFFILSSVLMPIGAGLISTFTPDTGSGKWIGYQILFGLGLGVGAQQPLNAVQTVLGKADIAIGSAFILFTRFLGAAIFVPVGQNLFIRGLVHRVKDIPGLDPQTVINAGATDLKNLVSGDDLKTLMKDYNGALVDVFYLVIAMSAVTVFGAVAVEWRSMTAEAKKTDDSSEKGKDAVGPSAEESSSQP